MDAHYMSGLLPRAVFSQELQEKKFMHNLQQYEVPLHKYMSMMELEERNERLFYKLLKDNVEELLPVEPPSTEINERLFYKLLIDNVEELLPVEPPSTVRFVHTICITVFFLPATILLFLITAAAYLIAFRLSRFVAHLNLDRLYFGTRTKISIDLTMENEMVTEVIEPSDDLLIPLMRYQKEKSDVGHETRGI